MNTKFDCDIVRFGIQPNRKLLRHIAQYPDDPTRAPTVRGAIARGMLDDELFLVGRYIRPDLHLELFTVEHSPLLKDGATDPSFRNFGRAWYHGVLEVGDGGILSAHVRAVLLDQNFGFDVHERPSSTGTFHIGLWLGGSGAVRILANEPSLGVRAGVSLAMISVPIAATGLGPLCTDPSESLTVADGLV